MCMGTLCLLYTQVLVNSQGDSNVLCILTLISSFMIPNRLTEVNKIFFFVATSSPSIKILAEVKFAETNFCDNTFFANLKSTSKLSCYLVDPHFLQQ